MDSMSTDTQRERLAKLAADTFEPETSDIPEAPPGAWATAEIGKFYRPRKEAVTIRLDADVDPALTHHPR